MTTKNKIMKVTIENKITHPTFKLSELFGLMINSLVKCENRKQLKNELTWLFQHEEIKEYFEYGFGGNHLWISERCTNNRIIFVEL